MQPFSVSLEIKEKQLHKGRDRFVASLVSEDGQTVHIYEGQLKEVRTELEVGKRYKVEFRPFVNNYWLELKIVKIQLD